MDYVTIIQGDDTNFLDDQFIVVNFDTTIDLSGLDTSNVTTMSYMFEDCYSLKGLDLSDFYTNNETNMNSMFTMSTIPILIFGENVKKISGSDMFYFS